MPQYILALDQGTTSSRSIVFGRDGRAVASAQQEFPQILPSPGHVEHDPEAIWQSQLATAKRVLEQAKLSAADIAAIGITNQRETTVLWERTTGKPVANAIVWQDTWVTEDVGRFAGKGGQDRFRPQTGLPLSTYFSSLKLRWLLENVPGARGKA